MEMIIQSDFICTDTHIQLEQCLESLLQSHVILHVCVL